MALRTREEDHGTERSPKKPSFRRRLGNLPRGQPANDRGATFAGDFRRLRERELLSGFSLAIAPVGDEFGISFALVRSAVDRQVRTSSMVI